MDGTSNYETYENYEELISESADDIEPMKDENQNIFVLPRNMVIVYQILLNAGLDPFSTISIMKGNYSFENV